jgi:hypothetical protein
LAKTYLTLEEREYVSELVLTTEKFRNFNDYMRKASLDIIRETITDIILTITTYIKITPYLTLDKINKFKNILANSISAVNNLKESSQLDPFRREIANEVLKKLDTLSVQIKIRSNRIVTGQNCALESVEKASSSTTVRLNNKKSVDSRLYEGTNKSGVRDARQLSTKNNIEIEKKSSSKMQTQKDVVQGSQIYRIQEIKSLNNKDEESVYTHGLITSKELEISLLGDSEDDLNDLQPGQEITNLVDYSSSKFHLSSLTHNQIIAFLPQKQYSIKHFTISIEQE